MLHPVSGLPSHLTQAGLDSDAGEPAVAIVGEPQQGSSVQHSAYRAESASGGGGSGAPIEPTKPAITNAVQTEMDWEPSTHDTGPPKTNTGDQGAQESRSESQKQKVDNGWGFLMNARPKKGEATLKRNRADSATTGPSNIGLSESARRGKAKREAAANGTLVVNQKRWQAFVDKILELDPGATVEITQPGTVVHSPCQVRISLKEPCNVSNFKKHIANCSVRVDPPSQSLLLWVQAGQDLSSRQGLSLPEPTLFCPGLTEKQDSRIPRYIGRKQSYFGGGGRSELAVAKERFPNQVWSKLSDSQKKEVQIAQQLTWKWVIDVSNCLVRSTTCERIAQGEMGRPCRACREVLLSTSFKTALNVTPPPSENIKYIKKQFRLPGYLGDLFATVRGLKELVQTVRFIFLCVRHILSLHATIRIPPGRHMFALL